ncbi:MAG TPA: phosphodiesterase YaeI [Bryobacteraceae bacterium]|nr:phosphodiesterase YaeI [Bryobacteraceae bacterium]
MNRRNFLLSAPVGLLASTAYAFGFEPQWLETTSASVALPGLDPGSSIHVLHLSDLHASAAVPWRLIERATEIGLAARPDLVCLTGDFITDAQQVDASRYTRLLRRLSSSAPTLAVLGNHDGGPWVAQAIGGLSDTRAVRALLHDGRIGLLHNRSVELTVKGQSIRIAGVGDFWNEDDNAAQAFADLRGDAPIVFLAHNPDMKDRAAAYPWNLMLCGHTHGGQVLIPGIGTRFVAVRDKRFISGLKEWNGRRIYITRGVGSLAGVRINCRPEVTLLRLTGQAA